MKRSTILLLIAVISCIMVPLASAGTWSDGFEDENLDEWVLAVKNGPTTFRAENGELLMEVHSWSISMLRVIDSDQWEDYTVTVKVKIIEIIGTFVDGGIFIRLSKRPLDWLGTFYYFFVADEWGQEFRGVPPEGEGAFVFPRINDQVPGGKAKVFTPELDHWYTLKATAQEDHTGFYIDDDLVGEFDHREIKSGSVGLVISNAIVHFDDFVVTGPDVPDGGPGDASFSVRSKDKLAAAWGTLKQER